MCSIFAVVLFCASKPLSMQDSVLIDLMACVEVYLLIPEIQFPPKLSLTVVNRKKDAC